MESLLLKTVSIALLAVSLCLPLAVLAAAPPAPAPTGAIETDSGETAPGSIEQARALIDAGRYGEAERMLEGLVRRAPDDSQTHYWLGRALFLQRQFDEGLRYLERSVELAPANLRVLMDLGRSYEFAGRVEDAARVFARILDRADDEALLREARRRLAFHEARRAVETGRLEEALAIYRRLLEQTPDDPRLLELIAPVLEELGRHGESDRIFTRMLEQRPADAGLRMRLAATYERRGDSARAEAFYAEAIALEPGGDIEALALDRLGLNRAVDFLQEGRPTEALRIFEHILALAPDLPAAVHGSGLAYEALGRREDAEKAYLRVAELVPGSTLAWFELAQLYEQAGRTDDAIAAYERVERAGLSDEQRREIAPRLNALYAIRLGAQRAALERGDADIGEVVAFAEILVRRGFAEDATRLLRIALEQAPDNAQVHAWLGRAEIAQGETERGIAMLERGRQLAPGNREILTDLARAYEQVGRLDDAERGWQELIRRASDDTARADAERGLGLLTISRRQLEEDIDGMLAEIERMQARFPDDLAFVLLEGRVLLALNRDAQADGVFAELLAREAENLNLRLQVAQLYREAGRNPQAERVYLETLELDPSNVQVRLVLAGFYIEADRHGEAFDAIGQALTLARGTPMEPQAVGALARLEQILIGQARRAMTQQDVARARTLYTLLLERQPESPAALFGLSEVARAQGRPLDQARYLERMLAVTEVNLVLKRRLGIAYDEAGELEQAESTLTEVVEAFPFDSEVRARLAALHERRGDRERARAEYLRLLELNPVLAWRTVALDRLGLAEARAQQQRGDYARALATARRVAEDVTDDPLVHLAIADILREAGRFDDAEAAYAEALRLAPGDPDARLGLARARAAQGREDEAVTAYAELTTEQPPSPRAETARGELDRLLLRQARQEIERANAERDPAAAAALLMPAGLRARELGGLDAAREVFEQLVRIAPDSAEAHYQLGLVYAGRNEHADSAVVLKRAVDIDPGNARYQRALGRAYQELRTDRLAEEALTESARLDRQDPLVRADLGALYRSRGDEVRAQAAYVRVLELSTDRESFLLGLQGLGLDEDPDRLDRDEVEQALRTLEQYLTAMPRSPQVRLYLGVLYHRALRLTEAESLYRELLPLPALGPQTALRLARLMAETGRTDEAIGLLDRVIATVPDPRLSGPARQQQTALYARQADLLAADLNRGNGDVADARRLARLLIERNVADQAVPMLEAASRRAPRDPEVWYLLGRAHADRGRFDQGIEAMERSVALVPDHFLVLQHLAGVYEQAGRIDEAVPLYERLSRQGEDAQIQRQSRMRLGLIRGAQLAEAGNPAAALREYDALLELFPDEVTVLGERGRMLVELGRDEDADATFARVLELAPDSPGVRLRLAEVYRSRGDTTRSLEQLAAVIRISPASPEALHARRLLGFDAAEELLAAGALDDAEEILERMLTVVPDDQLTRYRLGDVYYQQGRYAEAEVMLTGVTQALPGFQDPWLTLGNLYEALEREDSAIHAYERVLELGRNTAAGRQAQPLLAALYGARIQAMLGEGRDEEAMSGLERMVRSDGGNVAARTTLAFIYTRAGRFDDAIEQLRTALRLQPDNPRTWMQLGGVYTAAGRDMPSAEAYAYAIAHDTDEERIKVQVRELVMSVARHMVEEDRPFAAIRHLRGINDQDLGNERTYFMLASLYRQQGRFDESTRAFRDAVRFAPDNVAMRFNLAELYERSNDFDLALIQYRHIVRVGVPGDQVVEEARRRASALRTRLALFTSQLSYSTTIGESTIEELDLSGTGAINTRFSSQLFYNLGTNFWPVPSLNLRLDTGLAYVSNHSTERDLLVPRFGVSGNLNFPRHFYSANAHVSDIKEMISETSQGRSYNASLSAGLRFTDTRDLLQGLGWRGGRLPEQGESRIERAPELRLAAAVISDNPALRRMLEQVYRRQLQVRGPVEGEAVRRYQVRPGDGAREIAAAIGVDVNRWEAEWRDNPRLIDPSLILPGDTIARSGPADDPTIGIESGGETAVLASQLEGAAVDLRLAREARIRSRVEEGMAQYRAGLALSGQGRLDAAEARFEQILAVVPNDPLTLLNLGIVQRQQGRSRDALQTFDLAVEADPSLHAARLGRIGARTDLGDFAGAVAALEEMVAAGATASLAQEIAEQGLRIANTMLGQAIQTDAEIGLLTRVAVALSLIDQHGVAEQVLEALVEAWPFSPEPKFMLAVILHDRGLASEALPHAQGSVDLEPNDERYERQLARIQRDLGNFLQAGRAYEQAIALTPEPAARESLLLEAAMADAARLEAEGDIAQAAERYRQQLAAHPDDVDLLMRAASAEARLGLGARALAHLEHAIGQAPERFDLRLRLADLHRQQGRGTEADETLAVAMRMAETPAQRREVLDRLGFEGALEQIQRGRWGRARTALGRIQAITPDDPLVLLNLGAVHQQQRRYPEAEAAFLQVLDADPRNLTAKLRLGLFYSVTDRIDRAIALLEQVVSEGAGHEAGGRAAEALGRLEERRLRRLVGADLERASPTMKTLQARVFWSDSDLPVQALTETFSYGAGLTFFYRSLSYGDWIMNYTFLIRENEHPLGTDYAYGSNEFGLTWRTSVRNPRGWFGTSHFIPGLTGVVSLTREMRLFTFADTNALNALNQERRRRHDTDNLTLGLVYQPPGQDKLSLFANYSLGRSRSDLPVGIVFSPDGIPISFQSRGLGDFSPSYITLGVGLQF